MLIVDQDQMKLVSAISEGASSWTAERAIVNGHRLVALRLTDGALVYLHPDIAEKLGKQLVDAAKC